MRQECLHRTLTDGFSSSLSLSQPGVSNALARLRKLTDDPLFLRTPNGMEPTPYAQQLAGPTATALQVIHAAITWLRSLIVGLHGEGTADQDGQKSRGG